jgi:hypothetical protein
MKSRVFLMLALCLLVACGAAPSATPNATPNAVATQVAVMEAAAATLTAQAPTPAPLTATSPPAATATPLPPASPTTASTATAPPPSATVPAPTATVPAPTATPTLSTGPSLGPFTVVNVSSDDVLNVRSGPGVGHPVAGTIPYYGLGVEVHAGGQEVSGSWWVPVQYEAVTGWVNSNYLARQMGWASEPVAARAAQIILALKDREWGTLGGLVHPAKGVRLSPYSHVRANPADPGGTDLMFSAEQITGLWSDPTVYHWGTFDGSGEPIDYTFQQYYERFVYDVDFAQPDVVGFNQIVGQGNTINNIASVYPSAQVVEYHFEGFDPQYAGLDWRSLRLVLEEMGGTWYLTGIVHDEWTI